MKHLEIRLTGNPGTRRHLCASVAFRTAVPFWGQTIRNLTDLYPKRDCGSKRVKRCIIRPENINIVVKVFIGDVAIVVICSLA